MVVFTVSEVTLAKEHADAPSAQDRAEALRRVTARREWATVTITAAQLIADIAEGFDAVIMGADKWAQINDPAFYRNSPAARDAALNRLPELAIAPRGDIDVPPGTALDLPAWTLEVSSTAVRDGAEHWRA